MTPPIVKRLRRRKILTGDAVGEKWIADDPECKEAADTIEEIVKALNPFGGFSQSIQPSCADEDDTPFNLTVRCGDLRRVDALLAKIGGEG